MGRQKCSTAEDQFQSDSAEAPKRRFHLFYVNFFWIIALGVVMLYWIGSFTDQLKTAVGLLGLGGIFAWMAFFFNLVREERKKELQLMLDDFLKLPIGTLFLAIITGILAMIALNVGCIITDSSRDTLDRLVEIRQADSNDSSYARNLWPRLNAKFPIFTGLRGRDYEIDAEGLPLMVRRVGPLRRVRVKVPGDFLRCNVVLVRPSVRLTKASSESVDDRGRAKHVLEVRLDGNDMGEMPFYGQTVWIGSGKPLHIPRWLEESWRLKLAADKNAPASTLLHWLDPNCYYMIPQLKATQELEVTVRPRDSNDTFAYTPRPVAVKDLNRQEDFPQIVLLDIQ